MKILLVDDNPFDRELVGRLLQRAFPEAELAPCESLDEFHTGLAAGEPSLVVTDYSLQWADGLKILALTKERYPHCPVVMFTDSGSEELVVSAMKAGLNDYVLKKHLRTLPQVVSHCLEEAQIRRERDRALEELAESERRFRTIADLVSDYAFSFIFGPEAKPLLTWISPSITRRFGFTLDELQVTGFLALVHRDDRSLAEEMFRKVAAGANLNFVHRLVGKSGEVRWVHHFCTPRYDPSGHKVTGGDAAARDVTEQRRAEEILQAQMAQLSLLNQVARAILERHDLASIFRAVLLQIEDKLPVDAAWIAQLSGGDLEIVGLTEKGSCFLAGCLAKGSHLKVSQDVLHFLAEGQTVTLENTEAIQDGFGANGALAHCGSLVMAPLLIEGELSGLLLAARQERGFSSAEAAFVRATAEHLALAWRHAKLFETLELAYHDLRQTQAAMMQQERLRALGQMASGIAHDINNALSPVSLFASALLRDPTLPEKHRRPVEVILNAVESAAQTLRRLKDFYRTEPAVGTLEATSVPDLVARVVELTRPKWSDLPLEHGVVIKLVVEIPPDLPPFYCSPNEIRDALTNLILNAVDAMPAGGTITVRAHVLGSAETARQLVLEVQDEGTGMDEETRSHALEPFFTTKPTGTGMGLATVYGIVRRHGGSVDIVSQPQKGTTVRLVFPLQEAPTPKAQETHELKLPKLKILFVDDEPLIREALGHTLQAEGHQVDTSDSGPAALKMFDQALEAGHGYQVVITDLGMPEMDGRQLAHKIKARSPAVPVILLSGWGMMLKDKEERHVDAVLSKPPNVHHLKRTIAQLLNRGQQSS